MYFNVCPHCGAHLDPGERCDCLQEKQKSPIREHIVSDSEKSRRTNYESGSYKQNQRRGY